MRAIEYACMKHMQVLEKSAIAPHKIQVTALALGEPGVFYRKKHPRLRKHNVSQKGLIMGLFGGIRQRDS